MNRRARCLPSGVSAAAAAVIHGSQRQVLASFGARDRLRILTSTSRCGCKLRYGLTLVVGLQPRTSGTDQAVRAGGESCAGRQWCRRPAQTQGVPELAPGRPCRSGAHRRSHGSVRRTSSRARADALRPGDVQGPTTDQYIGAPFESGWRPEPPEGAPLPDRPTARGCASDQAGPAHPGPGRRSGPGRRRGMRQTVAMSITRRRLGTGPTATSSTPPVEESPRLLPVERVDLGGLLEAPEPSDPDPEVTRLHRRPLRSPAVED